MKKLLKKIAAAIMVAVMVAASPVLPQSVSLTAQSSAGYWKKDFTPEEVIQKASSLSPNSTIKLENLMYKDNGLGQIIKIDLTTKGKGTVRFFSHSYDLTTKSRYRLYNSAGELIENGTTISLAGGKSYSWSGVHYLFVTVAYGETADAFGYTYTSASGKTLSKTFSVEKGSTYKLGSYAESLGDMKYVGDVVWLSDDPDTAEVEYTGKNTDVNCRVTCHDTGTVNVTGYFKNGNVAKFKLNIKDGSSVSKPTATTTSAMTTTKFDSALRTATSWASCTDKNIYQNPADDRIFRYRLPIARKGTIKFFTDGKWSAGSSSKYELYNSSEKLVSSGMLEQLLYTSIDVNTGTYYLKLRIAKNDYIKPMLYIFLSSNGKQLEKKTTLTAGKSYSIRNLYGDLGLPDRVVTGDSSIVRATSLSELKALKAGTAKVMGFYKNGNAFSLTVTV
ncbi:MAG: hypothetical protein IK093_04560 [Ruminiclostridium sp.]|nr:hypothetical protein [Ruminiclostridium sp.]